MDPHFVERDPSIITITLFQVNKTNLHVNDLMLDPYCYVQLYLGMVSLLYVSNQ
jgi:hypothetical protein